MWNFIKKHKWLLGSILTVVTVVSILGVQVNVGELAKSVFIVGQGQTVIRIGNPAYASGTVDYVCDGTDDDIQFQGALDALPTPNGGTIEILAGNYDLHNATTITRALDNVTIIGTGRGTYITGDGATAIFTAGGNNWTVRDLRTDAGGLAMGATTGWSWENVTVNATYYAYMTDDATTASSWNIPTGRSATYVIAASDALAHVKAQADYVCDGTADNVQIQAAIDALPVDAGWYQGGVIQLSGGTFNLAATVNMNAKLVTLQGTGDSTVLYLSNNVDADMINLSAHRCRVKYMRLDGNKSNQASGSGINITAGQLSGIEDVEIWSCKENGLEISGTAIASFADKVYSYSNDGNGFYIDNIDAVKLINCSAVANGIDGFNLDGQSNYFLQLEADQNTRYGIHLKGGRGVLSNFSSMTNQDADLMVYGCHETVISDGDLNYYNAAGKVGSYTAGLAIIDSNDITIGRLSIHNYPTASGVGYGVYFGISTVGTGHYTISDSTIYSLDGDLYIYEWGVNMPVGCLVTNNQFTGALKVTFASALAEEQWKANNNQIRGNNGYIAPSEVRTASGSLTGGAANAILFAWHNPELQDIFIKKVIINITSADADAANIDVGIADDATYTNGGTEFFNDLKGETIQVNDSLVTTEHTQTIWVLCQDSASATDGWVVAKILDNDGTSIVGSWYIEYIGK
jgi:hypothetical protein